MDSKSKRAELDGIILNEFEPIAESSLNAHIRNKDVKEWHPSELVPFEKSKDEIELDSATKSALYINGLTEDNLAHYTSTLKRLFGRDGAWGEWNNRWTWEESLHGRAIERYIDHIGIFDNNWLESTRKAQLTSGNVPEPETISEISIYATIQEELTRLAHSRLGQRLGGIGKSLFALIAGDENRHHKFYASISTAIREQFPDEFSHALHNVTKRFDMPGLGMPGYKEHAHDIELAGIFTSQDVAKTIGKIATGLWNTEGLVDDVKEDMSKDIAEKINRRLATYRRIASSAIQQTSVKNIISWVDGTPVIRAAER